MANSHRFDHKPFLVPPGKKIRLKDYDPGYTGGISDKAAAQGSAAGGRLRAGRNAGYVLGQQAIRDGHHLASAGCGGQRQHDRARDVAASIRKA